MKTVRDDKICFSVTEDGDVSGSSQAVGAVAPGNREFGRRLRLLGDLWPDGGVQPAAAGHPEDARLGRTGGSSDAASARCRSVITSVMFGPTGRYGQRDGKDPRGGQRSHGDRWDGVKRSKFTEKTQKLISSRKNLEISIQEAKFSNLQMNLKF